ncbi:MAG: hypothetical protein ACLRMZ_10685 [Blautia marasmi]
MILTKDFLPVLTTNHDDAYLKVLKEQDMDFRYPEQRKVSTVKPELFHICKRDQNTPFLMCSVIKTNLFMEHSALDSVLLPVALLTLVFFLLLAVLFSRHIAKPMVDLETR